MPPRIPVDALKGALPPAKIPELDLEPEPSVRPTAPDQSQQIAVAAATELESRRGRDHTPSLPPPLAKVGRYQVLGRVAVGGMAEIFLAREEIETGALRHVGVKLIKRQSADDSDEQYFEEMFLREGRTTSQLVHPNICHVYEFGKWGSDYFIAMEWIDGVALRNVLIKLGQRRETMPPNIAAGIAAQVAGALEYAHTARDARRRPLGVVHLDVNPQNIMLRHDGVVKLLDFGVAQVADPQGDSRTDMVKGKTGYLAPEQALQKELDGRVDVFALGVCLFEMLSGRRLYHRDNLRASLEALLKEPVPNLRALNPAIPEQLEQIVMKALAKDRADRFQSAGELQGALEAYLARNREVISNRSVAQLMETLFPEARREGPSLYTGPEVADRLVPEPSPEPAPEPEQAGSAPTSSARSRTLLAVAAAALLAAGALSGWLWSAAREPSAPSKQSAQLPGAAEPAPASTTSTSASAPAVQGAAPPRQETIDRAPASEPASITPPPAPVEPARPRRRVSPGFVADPGF